MFLDQPIFILLPLVVFYYVTPIYLGYYLGRCEKSPVNLLFPVIIICLFYLLRPYEINTYIYISSVIVPSLALLFAGYIFGIFKRRVIRNNSIPYILGITGLPCSGKSEASRILDELGAKVINVDKLGHKCLVDKDIIDHIISEFGEEVTTEDNKIDRAILARVVFNSEKNLRKLENILHPEMIAKIEEEIKFLEPEAVLVLDAAILHHMKLDKICNKTVVTYADKTLREEWAKKRNWDPVELDKRDKAVKKSLSYNNITLIINDDSKDKFKENIEQIWKEITNERRRKNNDRL